MINFKKLNYLLIKLLNSSTFRGSTRQIFPYESRHKCHVRGRFTRPHTVLCCLLPNPSSFSSKTSPFDSSVTSVISILTSSSVFTLLFSWESIAPKVYLPIRYAVHQHGTTLATAVADWPYKLRLGHWPLVEAGVSRTRSDANGVAFDVYI